MRSFLSVARSTSKNSADRSLEYYQALCASGEQSLDQCWKELGPETSASTLATLVKEDLQRRFDRGERPKVAEYLSKYPILVESDDRVLSLVYEEFCLLQEHGENPDSQEFCEAYAPWRDSLLSQLAYHRQLSLAVGSDRPSVKFPAPGDRFDKYRLSSILGKGGVAQVYLATEEDLGGRKLAIKVSDSFGQEPSILGKLDHHNIVPILTVARSESGLRGICMPYRPGITLEELIRRIGRGAPPQAARAIWDALNPVDSEGMEESLHSRSGWESFPIRRTYSDGVAWIGLALSNALSYLHGRGVFHRDIKPANVLLAYREGPQLLDFNLAQDPNAAEHVTDALKGGTLPYMAPEQLRAFIDPVGWTQVDSSADLYSLGLMLKELMTGQAPDVPSTRASLPRGIQNLIDRRIEPQEPICDINPRIPPSLASIIEKSLRFDPKDRYATAENLAEDLRLFLDRRPLEHAPNRSRIERVVNWICRNRNLSLTIFSVLVFSALGFWSFTPSRIPDRWDFRKAEALLDSGHPADLKVAREGFEALHRKFPHSAWPSLCLGLTLEKIGDADVKRASGLIELARSQEDAEEALTARLQKQPASATVLMTLGIYFKDHKAPDQARVLLNKSFEVDPSRCMSLVALADVERQQGHQEESLRTLEKAVVLAEKSKMETRAIYELHQAIIPMSLKLAEQIIDRDHQTREREAASDYLDHMEAALNGLRRDWRVMNQATSSKIHAYADHLFTGCLDSCRAELAAERSNLEEASRLFDVAQSQFDEAFRTITPDMPNAADFRNNIVEQQLILKRRIEQWTHSRNSRPNHL